LNKELQELQHKVSSLQDNRVLEQRTIERLTDEKAELASEKASLKVRLSEALQKNTVLQDKLAKLENEANKLKNVNGNMKEIIDDLNVESVASVQEGVGKLDISGTSANFSKLEE